MAQFRLSTISLTGMTNMNRVYALQRVNSAYSGNIINLTRSSDSATADFTMDPTNSFLVTASGGQTVAAWLGAATANVATWYDQSGNGRNLTQATTTLQPGFSTTTGVQFRSGLRMAFPDNGTITDVTFCAGFVQNAYIRGNAADPWYLQDGIIPNELGGPANDWGLLLPGAGKFGMAFGTSDSMNSISTNGLGNYSFMTATRVSATGSLTLYNGTGTGTNFTGMSTGSKNGSNPCYMGYNITGNMQYMNADMASLFWFDGIKDAATIASLASVFTTQIKPYLNAITPIKFYTTNFTGSFSQLSTSAKNSVTGIFALKALLSSSARVVNIRNGTTSATADFYADINGNLTTSSGQTFASWIGAATGYITTWYDQSSKGSHMSCSSTGIQPILDNTNKWIDFKTSAWFDTSATPTTGPVPYSNTQNYTIICRHNTIGNSDGGICGVSNAAPNYNASNYTNNLRRNTTNYQNYWFFNDFNGGTYGTGNTISITWDGTNRRAYTNGSLITTQASSNWLQSSSSGQMVGKCTNSSTMNGEMYYLVMFNSALSDADRTIVENQPVATTPSIPINFFTTPYYSFTTFTFTPAGATGISGPMSLASYGTSYPGYGTSYALTLSGGTQLWKVPISGNYTITVAGAAGGSVLTTPTPGNGAILTLTTSLVQGHVIKIMVGQKGTDGNNATPIGGGGGGGTFVYNNTTSILIAAAGGGGGAGVISGGTYVSTMNGRNAQLVNSGLSGYSNPSGQWTGGAGGTAGSGGGAGSNLYGGAGGGYSGDGAGGALAFLNGGTGVGKGGFGGGGDQGLGAGGGGGGYSGGGGGGANKDVLGAGGGGGGGSYDITGAYSGTLTNTGTGYVTITKV